MPKHLVISTSGNPDSNSRRMGRAAFAHLQKKKSIAIGSISVKWICRSAMRTNVMGCPVQKN